jgi:hypothetical protein
VRQLVRVARELSEFARTTRALSPVALAVRDALLRAREPALLLFRDLPLACSMQPFIEIGTVPDEEIEAFVVKLRSALRELRLAYQKLLDSIEEALRTRLGLPASATAFREALALRAARLLSFAVESQLRGFLALACEDRPREEWLASLGALVSGKPPDVWHDRDVGQARFSMEVVLRRFLSLESMLFGSEAAFTDDVRTLVRVAVSPPQQRGRSLIVSLEPGHEPSFSAARGQIQSVVDHLSASVSRDTILAALGLLAHEIMSEIDNARDGFNQKETP